MRLKNSIFTQTSIASLRHRRLVIILSLTIHYVSYRYKKKILRCTQRSTRHYLLTTHKSQPASLGLFVQLDLQRLLWSRAGIAFYYNQQCCKQLDIGKGRLRTVFNWSLIFDLFAQQLAPFRLVLRAISHGLGIHALNISFLEIASVICHERAILQFFLLTNQSLNALFVQESHCSCNFI